MTLIIGVKCPDGIVIGADSITTYGSEIEQEVSDKIQLIADDALIANAGAVGMSQLINDELRKCWDSVKQQDDVTGVKNEISTIIWSQISPAMKRAEEARNGLGSSVFESILCHSFVALPVSNSPTLLFFDECAQPCEITLESPFFSIGTGSRQADPFLAFIRHTLWRDEAPRNVAEGIFSVLWALDHVSRVNAGLGVGGRSNVFVLTRDDSAWQAERLDEDYLGEQLIALQAAEGALRDFRDSFSPDWTSSETMQ